MLLEIDQSRIGGSVHYADGDTKSATLVLDGDWLDLSEVVAEAPALPAMLAALGSGGEPAPVPAEGQSLVSAATRFLASVDADGYWHIHGRSDDTIKVAGRRVGPAEIESALVTNPAIAEAAVIGVPDDERGSRVVAFVTLREGVALKDNDAIEAVARLVGKAMVPSEIITVASLPKTKNGKIMRRAIRARHLGEAPEDLSGKLKDMIDKLKMAPTASFDSLFVDTQVAMHRDLLVLFSDYAGSGENPALSGVATGSGSAIVASENARAIPQNKVRIASPRSIRWFCSRDVK